MKQIFALVFALVSLSAQAWTQTAPLPVERCQVHNPYGWAQTSKQATAICRRAYFVAYDATAKIPVYVSYTLLPQNALGCFPRTNAFVADASVPGGPRPDDYAGTGYDKGHAAPDGDMSWSQQVEYESFLMTNMSPQLPGLNRGIWKLLETATGAWVYSRKHTLVVYAGNVYNTTASTTKRIGAGGVVVPDALFKIIVDQQTNEVYAFLFPHKENQGNDLSVVQSTVAAVEKASGITFPLPQGVDKNAKPALWPVDFKSVADAKKALCKG